MSTSDVNVSGVDPDLPDGLLDRLGELAVDDPRRAVVRTRAIEWYLPLAARLARRFDGRGEPVADLAQVAVIGLIKAVDRFDVSRGTAFISFATPTILGEIKRHFRDATWYVRVPRPLQELSLRIPAASEALTHRLHRSPTTAELAADLGVDEHSVLSARLCANAYRPVSVDRMPYDGNELRILDILGDLDPRMDAVEGRASARMLMAALPARERRIIALRYVAGMTQVQIAADIGMSQMHVSRLLARSLSQLRAGSAAEINDPEPVPCGERRATSA